LNLFETDRISERDSISRKARTVLQITSSGRASKIGRGLTMTLSLRTLEDAGVNGRKTSSKIESKSSSKQSGMVELYDEDITVADSNAEILA
jgi:hypothetical protein